MSFSPRALVLLSVVVAAGSCVGHVAAYLFVRFVLGVL
jgi:hypothetical protein